MIWQEGKFEYSPHLQTPYQMWRLLRYLTVNVITCSMAKRVKSFAVPGVDCNKAEVM